MRIAGEASGGSHSRTLAIGTAIAQPTAAADSEQQDKIAARQRRLGNLLRGWNGGCQQRLERCWTTAPGEDAGVLEAMGADDEDRTIMRSPSFRAN